MFGLGVLGNLGLVGGGGVPSWVPVADGFPADLAFDFTQNLAWTRSTGALSTASSLLTCTRAISGTGHTYDYAMNSLGVYSGFLANVPRITDLGLLVEESRINSIRNNSMQGAAVGTTGTMPTNWQSTATQSGLTRSIASIGTVGNINYISIRYSGTPTATTGLTIALFESNTQMSAASGQTWTMSMFCITSAGSLNNASVVFRMQERNSGGGSLVADDTIISPTATTNLNNLGLNRITKTRTLNNASTAYVNGGIILNYTLGQPIDFTLTIGWPQMEQGAFATSPIQTTSAAVTRNADSVVLTSLPAVGSAYSAAVRGAPSAPTSYASAQNIIQLDDGTNSQRLVLRRQATTGALLASLVGGTGASIVPSGTWAQSTLGKFAAGVIANSQGAAFNATLATDTTAGTLPTTPTALRFGSNATPGEFFNGFIASEAFWFSQRITDAGLQGLTT